MRVRYRQTWRQVAPMWAAFAAFTLANVVQSDPPPLAIGIPIATAALLSRWFGVTLKPDEIVVHRFGSRHVPWTRVDRVERYRMLGGSGIRLVVDGRRVGLNAPAHMPVLGPDPAFDEKASTIERYWRDAWQARETAT